MTSERSKLVAPLVSAVALALGAAAPAQADVLADAVLLVTGAVLVDDSTDQPLTNGVEVLIVGGGNSANVLADLGSVPGTAQAAQPPILAPIDLPQVSQGVSPVAENNFTPFTNPDNPTAGKLIVGGNFAIADQRLTGALINIPQIGLVAGADAEVRASSYLSQTDTGDALSNVSAGVTFSQTIQPTEDITVRLDALWQSYGEAWVSADAQAPTSGILQYSFSFDIVDVANGDSILAVPGPFSPYPAQTASRDDGGPGKTSRDIDPLPAAPIAFSSPTALLLAGEQYTLTISSDTLVDTEATSVPEPATIGLLSAGLFGVGALARRRAKKQSKKA
jgi:hypothetical protein